MSQVAVQVGLELIDEFSLYEEGAVGVEILERSLDGYWITNLFFEYYDVALYFLMSRGLIKEAYEIEDFLVPLAI